MLVGVLVDVSGSMQSSLQLNNVTCVSDLKEQQINRVQTIFSTIMNIAQKTTNDRNTNNQQVFALAFGLQNYRIGDLLTLLDILAYSHSRQLPVIQKHLAQAFRKAGASFLNEEAWSSIPYEELSLLYSVVRFDEKALQQLISKLDLGQIEHEDYSSSSMDTITQKLNHIFHFSHAMNVVWDRLSSSQIRLIYFAVNLDNTVLQEIMDLLLLKRTPKLNSSLKDLNNLLAANGAPHAKKFIEKFVSEDEAAWLCNVFESEDAKDRLSAIIDELPRECKQQVTIRSDGLKRSSFYAGAVIGAQFGPLGAICGAIGGLITSSQVLDQQSELETRKHADRAMSKATEVVLSRLELAKEKIEDLIMKTLRQKLFQPLLTAVLENAAYPKVLYFKDAVELLHGIDHELPSNTNSPPKSKKLTADQLSQLSQAIEPFIYGQTPMCEALRIANRTFSLSVSSKILFILSDGEATDGDPTIYADTLKQNGVTIVCCLLISENIAKPRQLYYEPDTEWNLSNDEHTRVGRRHMFEMSSVIDNSHSALSVLFDQNWKLPVAGQSRLFVQANHPEVIDEFSSLVHKLAESNVVLNIIGRISLDIYINASRSAFKAQKQTGGTCYANAVAAVLHLAMRRIYCREDGVPAFDKVRERLINEYGHRGANTVAVLDKWCPHYRLQYAEVDEIGAREAVNARRPVVATFFLKENEWHNFSNFFDTKRADTLNKNDLIQPLSAGVTDTAGGHAVILMKIAPGYLMFMNSWGTEWGDDGFFRVKDSTVLGRMKFYDIYWTMKDLKPSEIKSYEERCKEIGHDIMKKVPDSVKQLPYTCPQCQVASPADTFTGHLLQAT